MGLAAGATNSVQVGKSLSGCIHLYHMGPLLQYTCTYQHLPVAVTPASDLFRAVIISHHLLLQLRKPDSSALPRVGAAALPHRTRGILGDS